MPESQALRQDALPLPGDLLDANPAAHDAATLHPALSAVPLGAAEDHHRIQLWDLPLRIFHWSLLAAVATAIATGRLGGEWMPLHGRAGVTIVGLLVFRLSWGFLGSTHARFASFAPTPGKVMAYLRGRWHGVGHNPLGALSVLGLIALLGSQAATGLFGNDDIAFTGPLATYVEEATSLKLTSWHHQLAPILYGLLGLHVAAIFFYVAFKREKLIRPMVTGWKKVRADVKPPRRARPIALVASVLLGVAAATGVSGIWAQHAADASPAPARTDIATPATGGAKGQTNAAPAW